MFKKKTKTPEELEQQKQLQESTDFLLQQKEDAVQKRALAQAAQQKKKAAKPISKKKAAKKLKIPKTAQDTIPYTTVFPDTGIIETVPGTYTRTYHLEDVNYQIASDAEQESMLLRYCELLNSFDSHTPFQITINQQARDRQEFTEENMLALENDGLDALRTERNERLNRSILAGQNELVKSKYLTVAVTDSTYEQAQITFSRLDTDLATAVRRIGGAGLTPMNAASRLELLHDIYNPDNVGLFGNHVTLDKNGTPVFQPERFRFDLMQQMGLTTKDMIAPESFTFRSDYGMVGGMFFRVLYLKTYPEALRDSFVKEITDIPCKMVYSMHFNSIEMDTAMKKIKADRNNINAALTKRQQQASGSGYSVDLVSPDLYDASESNRALRQDLTKNSQKLFHATMVIAHFAPSKEKLDEDTKALQGVGRRYLMEIAPLSWQQENGLSAALPLCSNPLQIRRALVSQSAAAFMPFVNQEIHDPTGIPYGRNAVSHNLIKLDRRLQKNGNGMIMGSPGSGKSMQAKHEIEEVILGSNDQVMVVDPDGEYRPMAKLLHGEVIRIAPGEKAHLNPLDINMNLDAEDDPITLKTNLMLSICEAIMGSRYGLTAAQKSIIDRCVGEIYKPYLESYNAKRESYDARKMPTLKDFYESLRMQASYDAMQLADALEIYAIGSQDLFAHQTNVDLSNRFIVFDIKDIGNSLKVLGELVVLNLIWNHIVAGRKQGKIVWFYVDEMHILFKNTQSAEFLRDTYKLARKYGGIPTGITQNVTDLLDNDIARTMIQNTECMITMSLSAIDRAQLGELLGISPAQLEYITSADPGHGLIYDGRNIVPFQNEMPKDTKAYEAMTTKLTEVKEIERRQQEQIAP